MIWEVAEAALKIDGVKLAHAVTGQFDVVVMLSLRRLRSLEE